MDLTPEKFEDLIGAYALDACEPDEATALDEFVSSDAVAAVEVERLREAAAALASIGARRPPTDLRARLLQTASERVAPLTPQEVLRAESDRFDALLTTIDPSSLDAITYNGLNVHDLVRHVELIDGAFVEGVDPSAYDLIGPSEVAEITNERIGQYADESFDTTVERYRATRDDLVGVGDLPDPDRRVAGYRRDDVLIIRAFETWVHNDDIRRAVGRDTEVPAPPVIRAMAELSMRSLPLAMTVRGTPRPERTARIVLTGPGGGDWKIGCAADAPVHEGTDVVVTMSVVDWCMRFADRLAPDALPMDVDGDETLARELVAAADAFAGL